MNRFESPTPHESSQRNDEPTSKLPRPLGRNRYVYICLYMSNYLKVSHINTEIIFFTIHQNSFLVFLSSSLSIIINYSEVGLGGLGVTCSPRDPRFAGSNPAEVDAFFRT